MKFGLFLLGERPPGLTDREVYANLLEQARWADELGFDEVWLAEHHFAPYGTIADPLVLAASIATSTRKIRIGTAVVIPAFHSPLLLAERVAMVDVLSDGRFDLGVGRGYQKREFAAFGIDMDESRARMQESVEIIAGLLNGEEFSYSGRFWSVNETTIYPRPVQSKIPIYVAALKTRETIRWIIDSGFDALVGNPYLADPQLSDSLKLFREEATGAGSDRHTEVWALINGFVHPDPEFARTYPRESMEISFKYVREYGDPFARGESPSAEYQAYADWFDVHDSASYEKMLALDTTLIGDPETVSSRIRAMQRNDGWENFLFSMNRGGALEQREVLKAMEVMASQVIPQVRQADG